jgi:hypothetical protein
MDTETTSGRDRGNPSDVGPSRAVPAADREGSDAGITGSAGVGVRLQRAVSATLEFGADATGESEATVWLV